MSAQGLAAVLRAARIAHSIEVIQGGVGQCLECGELLRVEYGDDGQPLFNPFIEHHLKVQADAALVWLETVVGDAAVRADVAEELRNVGHCPPSKYAEVAFMDANHAADAAVAALLAAVRSTAESGRETHRNGPRSDDGHASGLGDHHEGERLSGAGDGSGDV